MRPEPQPSQKKHRATFTPSPMDHAFRSHVIPWWCFLWSLSPTTNFFFFGLHLVTCKIVVPQPGVKPRPLALKTRSPNHWTTREPSLPTS